MSEAGKSGSSTAGAGPNVEIILNTLDEPITVIAPDYRVRYINNAARQLFDVEGKAAGEVYCYEISHRRTSPCSGDGHPCPMEEAERDGKSVRVLHEHYDAGGERHVVEIIASPLLDENGDFCGIVESQRDVTEREEADCLLRSYAEDLREANRIKDLFIDIMRHDLLGPAGVIRNAAALQKAKEKPEMDAEELDLIHRSSRKMIELIQNASALAKLEKADSLSFEPVALEDLVVGAAEELQGRAVERNVVFRIEAGASCRVMANPLLQSVFTNLLSNAIKYGPEGGEVAATVERKGQHCIVSVADRGEGIPDDAKEEVFTRFSRLEKGSVKGSGLGLAIVKRVLDLHGGRCWVEDNPGGGSIFRVELEAG